MELPCHDYKALSHIRHPGPLAPLVSLCPLCSLSFSSLVLHCRCIGWVVNSMVTYSMHFDPLCISGMQKEASLIGAAVIHEYKDKYLE